MNPGFTASTLQKFSIFLGLSVLATSIYLFQITIENPEGELRLKREQAFNAHKYFQLKARLDSMAEVRHFNYKMIKSIEKGRMPERDSLIAMAARIVEHNRFFRNTELWVLGFHLSSSKEAFVLEQVQLSENGIDHLSDTLLIYQTNMGVDEASNNQQYRLLRFLNIFRRTTPYLAILGLLFIFLGLRSIRKTTFRKELELLALKVEEQQLINRKLRMDIAVLENKPTPEADTLQGHRDSTEIKN